MKHDQIGHAGQPGQMAEEQIEHLNQSTGMRFRCMRKAQQPRAIDTLIDLGKDTDLYIMECNDFAKTGVHLSYEEIIANEEKFKSKRIILNHLGTTMLDNLDKVKIETASDGYTVELLN